MLRVLLFFERIETGFSGPMAEWLAQITPGGRCCLGR